MFDNSLRLVDECGLAFLHVFPFSPRPGTPAARMPQLERSVIKDRAARLRDTALARHLQSHVGRTHDALVERPGAARLADFTPVRVTGAAVGQDAPGALTPVRILGHDGRELEAEIVA